MNTWVRQMAFWHKLFVNDVEVGHVFSSGPKSEWFAVIGEDTFGPYKKMAEAMHIVELNGVPREKLNVED